MTIAAEQEADTRSALLDPRSIAVVGASADLGRPGGRVVAALRALKYGGDVYPVSVKHPEIAGFATIASVLELPVGVDLVIIAVRADAVCAVLRDAGERGARSAVILTSGFRETGPNGARLEAEIAAVARQYRLDVLGPNCLGFVDLKRGLAASFTTALDMATSSNGDVALVSQSGAMGAAIFGMAQSERIGISSFISTGNEAVLNFGQVLDRLVATSPPPALVGYIEGVQDGRALVRSVRAAREAGTRVAILKVGRTEAGQRAAQSHTGALSGSDKVWDAALRRCGAQRASSPTELLELSMAYSSIASPRGPRVAIVSMSGGAGVLMSDRASELGLATPAPDPATTQRLGELLPGFSATSNPIDFGAVYTDPQVMIDLVEIVARDSGFDAIALFVGLSPRLAGAFEEHLARIIQETGKPIVVSWFGAPPSGLPLLRELRIPATADPVRAIDMLEALVASGAALPEDVRATRPTPLTREALADVTYSNGKCALSETRSKVLLQSAGIACNREVLVHSEDEAIAAAARIDGDLVVKVEAPDMVHKSDAGGVLLGVDPDHVATAYRQVTAAAVSAGFSPTGVIVAELVGSERIELLVGTRWDQQFGAVVVVGSGGTTSEIDDDVCIDLAPVSTSRAREMILSLRCAPLFEGFRGASPFDLAAAATAVAAASQLAAGLGIELQELDVNPLAVFPDGRGCVALDAVAIVSAAEEASHDQ